jgi:WD40 repeat protein
VTSVAFSPDGKTLASGSADKTVILWDVATRTRLGPPLTHGSGVTDVAFSPDGKMLASGNDDNTITLWDAATRQTRGQPLTVRGSRLADVAGGGVTSVAFSPDGKTLASGKYDGTIILWDVVTRQPLGQPLTGYGGPVGSVAFSPDGKILAAGNIDNTIMLWDVDPASWAAHACRIANRNLTQAEWQQYLGDEPYRKTCPNLP